MQFDAGPGDRTDREWKLKDRQSGSQARRQRPRVTLPNWAFVAIPVGALAIIALIVVLAVRSCSGGAGAPATDQPPAVEATTAPVNSPTPTLPPGPTNTPTVELPDLGGTPPPPVFTEIRVGAPVVVQGTGGAGLNLREQPSLGSPILGTVQDGTPLTVIEGPQDADGFTWWKVQTAEGGAGWGVASFLTLAPQP
jgi:hypothetical protein